MSVKGRVGHYEEITAAPAKPDQTVNLKAWLMYLPRQHPFWSHYMLGVIHLRPINGVRPANKLSPEATHEIVVCALDPNRLPNPDDLNSLMPLTPINYSIQFSGLTDEQAV